MKNMKKNKKMSVFQLTLMAVFLICIILPLIRMFMYMDKETILKVIGTEYFNSIIINSLKATLIATFITLIIAVLLAFAIERTNIKFKGVFRVLLSAPMLIPSISIGFGLITVLGNNGLLTNLFGLKTNIYGLFGIVIGSVMYSFPVAFIMIDDVLKYEDALPYEAAEVFGISKFRQFMSITLPYLKKPLISVVFAVFTMIITDYGVPLMVGGKFTTLPMIMYQEVIGKFDLSKGSVYGAILLLPALVAFIIDIVNKDSDKAGFITHEYSVKKNIVANIIAYVFVAFIIAFVLLPIVAFIILAFAKNYPSDMSITFANISKTIAKNGDKYLLNSVVMAIGTSVVGTVLSFITAYMSARTNTKLSKLLHLTAITSLAIPGIVLGLSYVITFKQSIVYGTLIMLIMVNTVHFFASPYLMMYNSFNKLNENLEAVGETLGVNRMRMICDVFVPMSKYTLAEMFVYFFVNSMMTISAVSFLANTSNKPISLMITQFEAQAMFECAAVVSLWILIINILLKSILQFWRKRAENKSGQEQ